MEEWIGHQWHRLITHAADRYHAAAAVRLDTMRSAIALLFRAGGGPAAVRIAPAGSARIGGARGLLQRLAGSGTHAPLALLQPEVLALPSELAVFAEASLNRSLYLWLAALAAHLEHTGDWVGDHWRATQAALDAFPGLRARHGRLVAAHLAQRPDPSRLHGQARLAEQAVQAVLHGQSPLKALSWQPLDVAPVWLWLGGGTPSAQAPADASHPGKPSAEDRQNHALDSTQRRHAERVQDEHNKAPLVMFFRAESILSWGEFTQVNRADDDDDDGNAITAANDMDTLAIAADGRRAASRVRFDLDLPSAAQDDQPLGPGEPHPEWDCRTQRLRPDHCRVQRMVAQGSAAYVPAPSLRTTARRVRRQLEALRAAPARSRPGIDGDEIDLDAWVRHHVNAAAQAGQHGEPAVWTRHARTERSLATLLLADLSLSTDAYCTPHARVIDVIRDALQVFGEALATSGDAFEMLGFSSVRRQHVRIQHLKGFGEPWSATVQARVQAIKPGYYTRMGAAIRHATQELAKRPERQRLLLILTDGKPNDLDVYEGRYGLEDTRHAVMAARSAGLTPFCVTIDKAAPHYLPLLFGQQGYALVHRPQDLVLRLAGVYATLTHH